MTEAVRQHVAGLAVRAALASVATAAFLFALKGYAAWLTGSVAMLGSLADTGLDIVASLVTLWGVRLAATPADLDHRFGHGKAEALAALFQVVLITISAIGIAIRAAAAFADNAAPADPGFGIGVSIAAFAVTLGLLAYQRRIVAITGSIAIRADSVHYQSDLLLNGAVIAALLLDAGLGFRGVDPAFGILIALWLIYGAWRAASGAIDMLMDKEWPEDRRRALVIAASRHPQLKGLHDLRTRTSGTQEFAQFHIYVDPRTSVVDAHEIMDGIEAEIAKDFPRVDVLIHIDPDGHVDAKGNLHPEIAERWEI